jgi:hypothetical protein
MIGGRESVFMEIIAGSIVNLLLLLLVSSSEALVITGDKDKSFLFDGDETKSGGGGGILDGTGAWLYAPEATLGANGSGLQILEVVRFRLGVILLLLVLLLLLSSVPLSPDEFIGEFDNGGVVITIAVVDNNGTFGVTDVSDTVSFEINGIDEEIDSPSLSSFIDVGEVG